MTMEKCRRLSSQQKAAAENLAELCRQHEDLSISLFPDMDQEEQLFYLLSDDSGQLISFLSLTFCGEECLVHAFTHPSHRRKGFFDRLFDQAYEENIGPAFLFTVDDNAKDALAVLHALECVGLETEYLLQYRIRGTEIMPASPSLLPTEDTAALCRLHQACFPEYPEDFSETFVEDLADCQKESGAEAFLIEKDGEYVGLGFCIYQEDIAYLTGFGVLPEYRRQHIAFDALSALASRLAHTHQFLCVQVSDENNAACALYRSFGFSPIESVHTYLFE